MPSRPFARATTAQITSTSPADRMSEGAAARVAELRAAKARLREDVLAYVTRALVPVYSVEVAALLGASVLGRVDVHLAQRLAAGDGPRVMLAVRLAETCLDATGARAESEVG